MKVDIPFFLFANCRLVRGAGRSTICDLQRGKVHLIPNSLADLLTEFKGSSINQVKEHFNHEDDEIIAEYFEFLYKEELIFFSKDPLRFPELSLEWHAPSTIAYAILDIGEELERNFGSVCNQLDQLDCKSVELRGYRSIQLERVVRMLESFEETTITSVGLVLSHDSTISVADWEGLVDRHKRVTSLVVHGFPEEVEIRSRQFAVPVRFKVDVIESEQCCGIINSNHFVSNIEAFTESLRYNSCLNRKIGIDRMGNIKNCPSMQNSFGNIATTSLAQAIADTGFKSVWNINKDMVGTCRDCEFRYVCTDCRAYIENPEDEQSKPLKCGYDPYSCSWEDWQVLPVKQMAVEFYHLRELYKPTHLF